MTTEFTSSKRHKSNQLGKYTELNFGILFSNMMAVAEELWLDVDLIRLEGSARKHFRTVSTY